MKSIGTKMNELFRGRIKLMLTIASHSPLNILLE